MTATLLLSLLCIGPLVGLAVALTRAGRGGRLRRRALAVAAMGAQDLEDVRSYTRDCSQAACLLMAHRGKADTALVRRVVGEAVTQVDSVQRATRLRLALGQRLRARLRRLPSWPDVLLWLTGLLDADVIARLIVWRGERGISDLEAMTKRALRRFSAVMRDADEEPFVTLFADELISLGLLDAKDLEPEGHTGGLFAAPVAVDDDFRA